jgi:hypothetical protein
VDIERTDVRLRPGETTRLVAKDGEGRDVTGTAVWSVTDATAVRVAQGVVEAEVPGVTWVRAEYGGGVDSVRVVVSFTDRVENGLALSIDGVLSSPLTLAGAAWIYDRLDSDFDQTSLSATPGLFDPDTPPGIDFVGGGTRVFLNLGTAPEVGASTLESWIVAQDGPGGFQLQGDDGVAVWQDDPNDPDLVELYVSVGAFDIEFDRVDRPALAGLPNGVLAGRVAFDAAGLVVDLSQGPPRIVGQIGESTIRVFAEFEMALRIFPIGRGTLEVEGGPVPVGPTTIGAPRASLYRDGLILDYSIFGSRGGESTVVSNQIWIGAPGEGEFAVDPVGPDAIETRDTYSAERVWAWSGSGSDADAVFRGEGSTNAFSSGGIVRVTRYSAATEDIFGLMEGELEIPQTVYKSDGSVMEQTVRASFSAPVLPLALTGRQVVPPVEIVDMEVVETDPARPRVGDGRSRLFGRVREDGRFGVPGAEVRISGPAGNATAITNELGDYSFEGLTPGDYSIRIAPPSGFQLAASQREVVSPVGIADRSEGRLDFRVADAEGNGSLRIVAVEGEPAGAVDGVRVTVVRASDGTAVAELVSGTTSAGITDAKLPPGNYRLVIDPPAGFSIEAGRDPSPTFPIAKGNGWMEVIRLARE